MIDSTGGMPTRATAKQSRMSDGKSDIAIVGVVAGGLALCCGFSVLVSAGALGVFAGLGLDNWALLGLGIVIVVTGLIGLRSHSGNCAVPESEEVAEHDRRDS